ncbi:hypothetical protein BV20DRAFT_239284 [Pilatotrama ljubarskyi]|nr:hypothetical protein BV20DRAFT_239284 [Pilatotrama ljubarskyi]
MEELDALVLAADSTSVPLGPLQPCLALVLTCLRLLGWMIKVWKQALGISGGAAAHTVCTYDHSSHIESHRISSLLCDASRGSRPHFRSMAIAARPGARCRKCHRNCPSQSPSASLEHDSHRRAPSSWPAAAIESSQMIERRAPVEPPHPRASRVRRADPPLSLWRYRTGVRYLRRLASTSFSVRSGERVVLSGAGPDARALRPEL